MAKKLKKFDFKPSNRVPKHVFERFLDGQIWELTPQDLLTDDLNIARSKLTCAARVRGLRIRTAKISDSKFVVQAVPRGKSRQ